MRRSLLVALLAVLFALCNPARAQFCPGVSPWVFDDVAASDPFCGYITWMAQNGITLGCQVIDANHRLYCPNATVSRAAMAAFMNRLGNVRVEAVDTGPGLTGGPITGVGTINLATTQLLPTTACATNQVPKWNGTAWVCSADANSGGTVTSVGSGTGLTGGPVTASGTLSIAASYQLPQSCTNGQVPKSNGAGGWTCASDATGTGTVTSITAGAGLTGGTITTSGTIAVDPASATLTSNFFRQNGNAFGATAVLGTTDNNALDVRVNNARVMRFEPNAISPNIVAGLSANAAGPGINGGVIGGGGATGTCSGPGGIGSGPCENRVGGSMAVVAGGYANQATQDSSVVGGGNTNYATGLQATIAGGYRNRSSGSASSIGGGDANLASGQTSRVGGGATNVASGGVSSVGGGVSNVAAGRGSAISGGVANQALATGATIGGGGADDSGTAGNVAAAQTSTIAGGAANGIAPDGLYGAIGGGIANQISAPAGTNLAIATIGGGANNLITRGGATIAGGNGNSAKAFDAAVGGGNQNQVSGLAGAVPGGLLNAATGDYSFAAGRRAKAVNRGCFAWGDSTDADMLCNVDDRFVVRASGGVYLYTAPGVAAGAFLPAGSGTWSSVSDRDAKANVAPVDAGWVLERVAALPIGTWNYRTQDAAIRHLGPMAQDFRAAFGVGENDTTISTVDADGVALAAIQGLNAKVEAQAREIAELKAAHSAEIAELKRAIEVLLARTSPEGRVASR